VTVRVRFADLRSVSRSETLAAPVSATAILAEIAEALVRAVLAHHPDEKNISLLAISVSQLEKEPEVQLELSLGLQDEGRRPGSRHGIARLAADRAVDRIRDRFGWRAVGTVPIVGSGRSGGSAGRGDRRAAGVLPSSLSFHLAQLVHAGLISQRRFSRQLIYSAEYGAMNALLAYLIENCCGRDAVGAPVCDPAAGCSTDATTKTTAA
jgi:impB/mucB/samB family C-terminal domain